MTALTLDLMDLADVGGQPRKLATEIHRQIRAQKGQLILPVPLADIAAALGISDITERDVTTFEGMLVATPDKSRGAVILRKGMRPGRRNFTLGHEIGHFVNPYHKPPSDGFVCSRDGLRAKRGGPTPFDKRSLYDRMEVEANEFSQALLVPIPEYRRERGKLSGCDLLHVEALAGLFGLSKEAMARIYVDTAPQKIGILTSQAGRVRRFMLPTEFPFLGLKTGQPIPVKSATYAALHSKGSDKATALEHVATDTWLEQSRPEVELYEQALLMRDGWAMTLLLVEESYESDDEEEQLINERWSQPKFAHGR